MPAEPEVITTVQQLSRYLRDHPLASDTSDGIAQWWVEARGGASQAVVEAALDWMVGCGIVEAMHAADGRVRYRRRNDIDDIDARLDAMVRDPHAVFPPPGPSSTDRRS